MHLHKVYKAIEVKPTRHKHFLVTNIPSITCIKLANHELGLLYAHYNIGAKLVMYWNRPLVGPVPLPSLIDGCCKYSSGP